MKIGDDGVFEGFRAAGTKNRGGVLDPELIVVHYTANGSVNGAVEWFQNPNAKASAHLVIGRSGDCRQVLPFKVVAWHAGASEWDGRSGCNRFAIGIELVNWGPLSKAMDGSFRSWTGAKVPPSEAGTARHKHQSYDRVWQSYTGRQMQTLVDAVQAIRAKYGDLPIVGHEDVSPGRKIDPGPLFHWNSFFGLVGGRSDSDGLAAPPRRVKSTAYMLNVVSAPSPDAFVVGKLAMNAVGDAFESSGPWTRVKFGSLEGWCWAPHLTLLVP